MNNPLLLCEVDIFDQHGLDDWRLLFACFVAPGLVALCDHPSDAGQGLGQGHVWSQAFGEDTVQGLDEPGARASPPRKMACCHKTTTKKKVNQSINRYNFIVK